MNNPPTSAGGSPADAMSREELLAALFANMVVQQTNMAMMLLGKVAHPETGEFIQDVESARMFIDQLEMLAAKTKGNLTKQEEGLLKQALAALHMAYVEAVNGTSPAPQPESTRPAPANEPESAQPAAAKPSAPPTPETPPAADESRKKFSKKY